MWKSVLTGIILENIETLNHYKAVKDDNLNVVESILQYVADAIISLPWYFYIPIKVFANMIGLFCLIATGRKLHLLLSEKRSLFLKRIYVLPFFGMLNKLVRSMAFLKLFDFMPAAADRQDTLGLERNS